MADPEDSKIPNSNRSKIHPVTASNDLELDQNSYTLEKFRLYETRAVSFTPKCKKYFESCFLFV